MGGRERAIMPLGQDGGRGERETGEEFYGYGARLLADVPNLDAASEVEFLLAAFHHANPWLERNAAA